MNDKKQNFIVKYFSEFGVLRECGKNFWLTNFIQFFDGLSYFTLIIVFSLFLNKYCGFRDADAPYWVGMYTLFVSLFVFAVGTICDIIGLRRTYLIGFIMLIGGRLVLGMGADFGTEILQLSQDGLNGAIAGADALQSVPHLGTEGSPVGGDLVVVTEHGSEHAVGGHQFVALVDVADVAGCPLASSQNSFLVDFVGTDELDGI